MTTGLSGPDAALVHDGFRGSRGEEDTGDAENPETHTQILKAIILKHRVVALSSD